MPDLPGDFRLMGILNVTPDSFSDGGRFLHPDEAVEQGQRLIDEGADIVDVGGESTRPGAPPVALEQELARVQPVIEALAAATRAIGASGVAGVTEAGGVAGVTGAGGVAGVAEAGGVAGVTGARGVQISIDTSKAPVAEAALAAGASLVNDVTAFRADPRMAGLVAASGAHCCLMHMQGEPRTMQLQPRYSDVLDEVKAFLEERLSFAVREGVPEEHILIDPGIGFGKTLEHNLELLSRLDELLSLGRPILIGTSRKSFLSRLSPRGKELPVGSRLAGTIASNLLAYERGASVFRVHDVRPLAEALAVAAATLGGRWQARSPGRTPTS
jgi:dihydropteroate synthase